MIFPNNTFEANNFFPISFYNTVNCRPISLSSTLTVSAMLCLIACSIVTSFPWIWLLAFGNHNATDSPWCQTAKLLAVEQPCFPRCARSTGAVTQQCIQPAVPKSSPTLPCSGFALPELTLAFPSSLFERCTHQNWHWPTCSEQHRNKCQWPSLHQPCHDHTNFVKGAENAAFHIEERKAH